MTGFYSNHNLVRLPSLQLLANFGLAQAQRISSWRADKIKSQPRDLSLYIIWKNNLMSISPLVTMKLLRLHVFFGAKTNNLSTKTGKQDEILLKKSHKQTMKKHASFSEKQHPHCARSRRLHLLVICALLKVHSRHLCSHTCRCLTPWSCLSHQTNRQAAATAE